MKKKKKTGGNPIAEAHRKRRQSAGPHLPKSERGAGRVGGKIGRHPKHKKPEEQSSG